MATLRITIDLFSGRPNPLLTLSGKQARTALALLKSAGKREVKPLPTSTLGYRGLIIEQVDKRDAQPQRSVDPELETLIMGHASLRTRDDLPTRFPKLLRHEIDRFHDLHAHWRHRRHHWPTRHHCHCAPLYEPAWWNDAGQKQWNNNCYNYGCNTRTDTFAQPGLAAGAEYTQLSCASVRPAAIADALIAKPLANNKCPGEGHLVALVIAPGIDFHWYRKGRNGYWTHKPGPTAVTNVDNSNHLIPDPRTANRGMYTQFCTFMVVMHGHVKIR